jgi:transcriptional regulator with XRE-family HTH domain
MPTKTPVGVRHRVAIATALRTVRELQGLTQTEVAERIGLQQQLISRYESDLGGIEPSASTIFGLEEVMGARHGSVLRTAGLVDDGDNTVEGALACEPRLTENMREVVLQTYHIALRATAAEAKKPANGGSKTRRAAAQ